MADWITPIYDRTQADVDFAIAKLAEWKAIGETNVYDLKGCFNVSDINRIEDNIRYLSDNLSALYYPTITDTKTWDMYGLPTTEDISRIINNIEEIFSAYHKPQDAPDLPNEMLTYSQINDIEKNIYLLKEMLDSMISSFKECGSFDCGED